MALSAKQAAEYLSVHQGTLSYWRRGGYGPAYSKRGRNIFYRREALDAWREWCKEMCLRYSSTSYTLASRWAHKLRRMPGGEAKVPESHVRPPMLSGKSGQ